VTRFGLAFGTSTPTACLPGAICAAIERTTRFNTVTDNFAAAMVAGRSERVNRTFKAVEHVGAPLGMNFETLVVFIPTHFTLCHAVLLDDP
jgi:hypothetical protein